MQKNSSMRKVQYEKSRKRKKNSTWNWCNMKKVQHVKGGNSEIWWGGGLGGVDKNSVLERTNEKRTVR